jgi:hypothetical protein
LGSDIGTIGLLSPKEGFYDQTPDLLLLLFFSCYIDCEFVIKKRERIESDDEIDSSLSG